MFTHIHSAAVLGLDCIPITAEVDIAGSWPGYQIVGLADASIQEAKERIRTAWKNTGLTFPSNARIVINLAPADVRKVGSAYDLPMAVGMFVASVAELTTKQILMRSFLKKSTLRVRIAHSLRGIHALSQTLQLKFMATWRVKCLMVAKLMMKTRAQLIVLR